MEETGSVQGYVEDIIFHNEQNGYSVFSVNYESSKITVVGSIYALRPGEYVEISGKWTKHKRYGRQFIAVNIIRKMPDKDDALVKYLSSGLIKGIGIITAQRIVDTFKGETACVLDEQPERLAVVKGISMTKALEIGKAVSSQKSLSKTILFFTKFGISPEKGAKAYKYFGETAIEEIEINPYRLISERFGITFRQADRIAAGVGVEKESEARIYSGIRYVLGLAKNAGHTYLPWDSLVSNSVKILGVNEINIEYEVEKMIGENILVNVENHIYLRELFNAEKYIADKINRLFSIDFPFSENLQYILNDSLMELHINLDKIQTKACIAALSNGVSVISGGPGTGKTTIIKAIINIFEKTGKSYKLAAPTGRAAKKMQQSSGREAKTIHRLLEIDFLGEEGEMLFTRNENNPLDTDVVIIDEMSMVDIELMCSLMMAVDVGTRLILIGDVDQLPAVGPGKVLEDIIESGKVECTILKNIYRQESGSSIPLLARDVNRGSIPDLDLADGSFSFIETKGGGKTMKKLIEIILNEMQHTNDIQVISPGKKGETGTINLNNMMQSVFNPEHPDKHQKKYINRVFREGDKVMQIRNNYEMSYTTPEGDGKGIYNGDIGILTGVDMQAEIFKVVFDGDKRVIYDFREADQLEIAYAITVHKSQGSEYGTVVIPLFGVNGFLQNRNLLYTAVSRAVNKLYIIGSREILISMVNSISKKARYSGLKGLLID